MAMAMDERAIGIIKTLQAGRSLNQYARDIGVDPGQLWRILEGQQNPNRAIVALLRHHPERAAEIAAALAAPESEAAVPA